MIILNKKKKFKTNYQEYWDNINTAIKFYKKKDFNNFEKYMIISLNYGPPPDMLIRYYINNNNFALAKHYLEKKIELKYYKFEKDNLEYVLDNDPYTKQLVEYYKFKVKYPYIRKDLLKMFNIDIKTFNLLTKEINNDENYKKNRNYSNKIIDYLKEKTIK